VLARAVYRNVFSVGSAQDENNVTGEIVHSTGAGRSARATSLDLCVQRLRCMFSGPGSQSTDGELEPWAKPMRPTSTVLINGHVAYMGTFSSTERAIPVSALRRA